MKTVAEVELEDDLDHPIPKVFSCDIFTVKKDGGADLRIIIADPLIDNEKSRGRLLAKIENYLKFINGFEYLEKCGPPNAGNTNIIISMNADSDVNIIKFANNCRSWVENNNASLFIDYLLGAQSEVDGNA